MSLSMPEPILAALDIGQIFWLIVVAISVVSWIVNVVQGNPQNGAPRPQNRPKDPVQSELEKFLQEVVGGKRPAEQNRPAVPQQKQSRNANEKKDGKSKQQRPAKSSSSSQRQGERVVQSVMPTTNFDEGLRSQHLQTTVEPGRIGAAIQRDIDGAVLKDLGSDRSRETGQRADNPHPLIAALRNPAGVRQAILLNEVLGKPKALR